MPATTISADLLYTLAHITNRDEAGRHFTERYSDADLDTLEEAGLIEIRRPIHEATGIPYSQEYYHLSVTEAGQGYVDGHYDERDYADEDATQTVSLGEFGPSSVWFTSVGIPTGTTVTLAGEATDDSTGETYEVDPWDAWQSLPFNSGLEGTVNASGEWEWHGQGEPRDWNRNSVLSIKAFA